MAWEAVIGLEVHVQLNTRSKLFSGSSTAFGAAANTQANGYDLALPGVLPMLNRQAVRHAVKFGMAIHAEIGKYSVFDRKNYFYPDLPKGYQISQLDYPVVHDGLVRIMQEDGSDKCIRVVRAHLEEDAGKSLHEDFAGMTGIDLNRAGTPLLEIVSAPQLHSATEAVAYLKKLHSLVRYLEISDAIMAQGSLRCDANVSIRPKGESVLGTRTEIKNINSFRFVEKAINYEIRRQQQVIEDGGKVVQETRLYDARRNRTRPLRSKEEANDYRYFPEPDLVPLLLDDDFIADVRAAMPELPDARQQRLVADYGLSEYDAGVLTAEREVADYLEAVAAGSGDAKLAANWVMGELQALLNRNHWSITDSPIQPERLATLLRRIKDGTVSGKIAKTVFEHMVEDPAGVDRIIQQQGLQQVTDSTAITRLVEQVLTDNPAQVQQFKAGKQQVLGYLVGQAMKLSGGKANPAQVNQLLREKMQ